MMSNWKPSASARKLKKAKTQRDAKKHESDGKAGVRRRDGFCRFPLCGCRRLKWRLEARGEVSHVVHKGMGGNPAGDRSTTAGMILLCKHRHQDGAISRHRGTLREKPLTRQGMNGPIAWLVDADLLQLDPGSAHRFGDRDGRWYEIARESAVQKWEPFSIQQEALLRKLATMEL